MGGANAEGGANVWKELTWKVGTHHMGGGQS